MDGVKNDTINLDHFCLKWSNYQAHVLGVLVELLQAGSMVDVTLCASGGEKLFAHKIVLCAASSFFEEIFKNTDDNHPIVILSDVKRKDLQDILQFVYHGELNVHASKLSEVLQVAASLQIRGLTEVSDQLPHLIASDAEHAEHATTEPLNSTEPGVNENLMSIQGEVCDNMGEGSFRSDEKTQTVTDPEISGFEDASVLHEESAYHDDRQNYDKEEEVVQGVKKQSNNTENLKEALCDPNEDQTTGSALENQSQVHGKRKRRESCRKEYSEEQLATALEALREGHLLGETAAAHNIPRSTLYIRAKAGGVPTRMTRQEHSGENVNAAVQAVNRGASLQQASEMYQIPKTVLWRRVRAAGIGGKGASQKRQTYGPQLRQAAVQALEDGQKLSKVAAQFQIPKTTLFREKARLIEAGKLSRTLQNRDPHTYSLKHSRLKEAVAACKEGKMSQSVASITYQIPKTTIWRKLQRFNKIPHNSDGQSKAERLVVITSSSVDEEAVGTADTLQEEAQFAFIEGDGQLPVTYIVEEDLYC